MRLQSWVPNRGVDLPFVIGAVVVVVDGYDLPIRTLHAACAAEVPTAAIITQNDLATPRSTLVGAEARPYSERSGAPAVSQGETAIRELQQAGRILRIWGCKRPIQDSGVLFCAQAAR